MKNATISAKYQIVIPRALRAKLDVRPGQQVRVTLDKSHRIVIDTSSIVDDLAGSLTGVWPKDSDAYISSLRDTADNRRKA